jgi:hypothetical protein
VHIFDFTLLHNEVQGFEKLRKEIVERFTHVNSYHELLTKYMGLINEFQREWLNIEYEVEAINRAVVKDDVEALKIIVDKYGIKSVNQIAL